MNHHEIDIFLFRLLISFRDTFNPSFKALLSIAFPTLFVLLCLSRNRSELQRTFNVIT